MSDNCEEKLLQAAILYAKEAGEFIQQRIKNPGEISQKKNMSDLVTESDKLTEELLRTRIGTDYPGHWILAEEANGQADSHQSLRARNNGYGWIIDPIDGTTNFIHGIPHFSISIGIVRDMEPVVGVVYNPITRELFSARKGNGAFLNDQPVRVGIESSLDEALLATGFQAADWQSHSMPVRQIDRVTGKCRSVRIIGAASLDLCWVASGRLTGFWHDGLHPWDVAAGVLIVKEAGGQVTNRSGSPFALTDATLVASNAAIHPAFLQVIETVK